MPQSVTEVLSIVSLTIRVYFMLHNPANVKENHHHALVCPGDLMRQETLPSFVRQKMTVQQRTAALSISFMIIYEFLQ